jgi:hypothetical protein
MIKHFYIVPSIDDVTTIPHYHIDNGLRSLTVFFSEVVIYKLIAA